MIREREGNGRSKGMEREEVGMYGTEVSVSVQGRKENWQLERRWNSLK